MSTMTCYACKVAETHPQTTLRGTVGCTACAARGRALVRVDWWQVTMDLQAAGLSLQRISEETLIPKSTVGGYRNHEAEPRHRDGEALLDLWRRFVGLLRDPPTTQAPLRQRELGRI